MRIAYYGGTFDPIHDGHLTVARTALARMRLDRVLFVPTGHPPHKLGPNRLKTPLTEFAHRYAMVALALREAGENRFMPSLLEAPSPQRRLNYSVETLARLRRQLKRSDQLFFLMGLDSFHSIAKWHEPVKLLRTCEFIVVSRPGYSMQDVADSLPARLRPRTLIHRTAQREPRVETLRMSGVTIHLLPGVRSPVSATAVRGDLRRKSSDLAALKEPVPRAVADYIQKMRLYSTRLHRNQVR